MRDVTALERLPLLRRLAPGHAARRREIAMQAAVGVRITQTIVDNMARIVEQRATPEAVLADMTAEVQRDQARKLAEVPDKTRVAPLGTDHRVPDHYDPSQAELFLDPDYS